MTEANRDQNRVPTLLGSSSVDEETPVVILADPDTGELLVKSNSVITSLPKITISGTALGNNQVSVGTAAGGTTIVSASSGRQGVSITNQGSVDCYIGTGTVTASNGFLLKPGESVGIPTDSEIKGITASSTTTIGYLSFN